MDNVFTSGELVPYSGIYRMTHTPPHVPEETVTLTAGNQFPQCFRCNKISFMLISKLMRSD